jgi:hypothetical protein
MTHAANVNASDYVTTVIESLMRLGHRGALLVGSYLTMLGAVPKTPTKPPLVIPPFEMALGLAAMFQIWLWERAGLRPYLRVVDLPTSHDALNDFWKMESRGHAKYIRSKSGSRLLKQVVGAFLSHCALSAPEELSVDLAIDGPLDESMLEAFADFVWQHRHLVKLKD